MFFGIKTKAINYKLSNPIGKILRSKRNLNKTTGILLKTGCFNWV